MDRREQWEELQRQWTPPRGLERSTPREVRLSGTGIALVVVAIGMMLGGIALMVGLSMKSNRQLAEREQLREQGQDTEGRVTRHWRTGDKNSSPMVSYEFTWEGRTYSGKAQLPLRAWKSIDVGSPFAVRFLPTEPSRNSARDWEREVIPAWFPFVLGPVIAGVGVMFIYSIRRQTQLLAEGRAAPGIVTRHSRGQHGKRYVHFEFRLYGGAVIKGRGGPIRRVPPIGSTICVIYDRDNPKRNTMYPMEVVKLA